MALTITLDKFQLRPYQVEAWNAIFGKNAKDRIMLLWARRMGKDVLFWNAAILQCLMERCLILYVLQNYGSCRRTIWNAMTNTGERFLDFIPKEAIDSINNSDMLIKFVNGSILQLVGAETHDTAIRGTNPKWVILSEYAFYPSGEILDTVSPIIAANGGKLLIGSTPFGKNHYYRDYLLASKMPYWYVSTLKTSDVKHIPEHLLQQERERMSYEKFMQEYECSFDRGVEGAYFSRALEDIKNRGQVTQFSFQPDALVHCAIDIGVRDATTVVWFQVIGGGLQIRVIDCYSFTDHGITHLINVLQERGKNYRMGMYIAPHDMRNREWGSDAMSRKAIASSLGVDFTIMPQMLLRDQIENTLVKFPNIWINEQKCQKLLDALENYHREYDEERNVYSPKPVHDWSSDFASAFMLMCQAISSTETNLTYDRFMTMKQEALYGKKPLPWPFNCQ